MTPPMWFYEEGRIAIAIGSKGKIQVGVFKFVNNSSNSTNLKVNLLYETEFLFIVESAIYATARDTG